MTQQSWAEMLEFVGWTCRVYLAIAREGIEEVTVEGRLLSLSEDGGCIVQGEGGEAHHCWPALHIEVIEPDDRAEYWARQRALSQQEKRA